jgi:predicted phage baseplate assembly protein
MSCDCEQECACTATAISNPPGQRELRWRVAPHGAALERMRTALPELGSDDAAVALLDTWAVVTDVVSFYTERIAQEGFLRTATEPLSVRQLARTLGYELRPGVAAQAELAFDVETADTAPESVFVGAGTPVQTIPAPGSLPQIFETTTDLEAHRAWNAVAAVGTEAQSFDFGVSKVWLHTTTPTVQVDDWLLFVGAERDDLTAADPHGADTERWDFRQVTHIEVSPDIHVGWTRLTLHRRIGNAWYRPLVAEQDVRVLRFTQRLHLFGHNAPDPGMFVVQHLPPTVLNGSTADDKNNREWTKIQAAPAGEREIEVDGDHDDILPGSWIVLEQPTEVEAYQVLHAIPDGAKKFGLAGKVTRLELDLSHNLEQFSRRQAVVHAVPEPLDAAVMPRLALVGNAPDVNPTVLEVAGTTPPLPVGRLVTVTGTATDGTAKLEKATVTAVTQLADGTQRLVLSPALEHAYYPGTVVVRANLAHATHGETVQQVLGSGDGRIAFARFRLRRPPLTYVRSTTSATGVVAALEVRVEGVTWSEVPTLFDAGPHDQVYVVRQDAEANTDVVFGDGVHGARLPTGRENVRATYRVGIGDDGKADPGQISLPVRKPLGIAKISNLAASHDSAPPEDLEQARVNAPQRVRTLDRAVSVADYEDFARGYAGVGHARADLVWNGRVETVVLSVLAADGGPASPTLLGDLRTTLDGARENRAPRRVEAGVVIDVGASLLLDVDPRYEPDPVRDAVVAALLDRFGSLPLGAPLASSSVLVVAAGVSGVLSVTMPVLSPSVALPGSDAALLVAAPARWDLDVADPDQQLLPAQALRLVSDLLHADVRS